MLNRKKHLALSLIELIVAAFIFTIMATAIANYIRFQAKLTGGNTSKAIAISVAQNALNTIEGRGFHSVYEEYKSLTSSALDTKVSFDENISLEVQRGGRTSTTAIILSTTYQSFPETERLLVATVSVANTSTPDKEIATYQSYLYGEP